MLSTQSDDEYIARVEKKYVTRKKTGLILLVASLAMLGVSGYFLYDIGDRILSIANSIADVSSDSLQDEAREAYIEFSFSMGATLGMAVAAAFLGGVHLLIQALYLLYGSRKERLLIEFSKRLKKSGGNAP